jgi:hypothetical protein
MQSPQMRKVFMEHCKGFDNWFECLECPYLCTKLCPLEKENVIEEMKKQIQILSAIEEDKDCQSRE